jgi:hypothetical protein
MTQDRGRRWAIALCGDGPMLERAWRRAALIAGDQRAVAVIGGAHRGLFDTRQDPLSGMLVEEPLNRGTAPRVFLALSYIMAHDCEATALVFAADQFVDTDEDFVLCMEEAAGTAESQGDRVILMTRLAERSEIAVKAKTLWSLGWKHIPDIMDGFEALRAVIGLPEEAAVLKVIYDYMKPANFLKDLLEPAVDQSLLLSPFKQTRH